MDTIVEARTKSYLVAVRLFGCGTWTRMIALGLFPGTDRLFFTATARRLGRQQALEPLRGLHIDFSKLHAYNTARCGLSPELQKRLGIAVKAQLVVQTHHRTKEQVAAEIDVLKTKCCYSRAEVLAVLSDRRLLDELFAYKTIMRLGYNASLKNSGRKYLAAKRAREDEDGDESDLSPEEAAKELRRLDVQEAALRRRLIGSADTKK